MKPLSRYTYGMLLVAALAFAATLVFAGTSRAGKKKPSKQTEDVDGAVAPAGGEKAGGEKAGGEKEIEATGEEGEEKPDPGEDGGGAGNDGEVKKKDEKAQKSDTSVLLPASEKGATVVLDGEEVGVTPLAPIKGLSVGTHELEVSKEGYYLYKAELDVPSSGTVRHDVLLEGGASKKTELPEFMKTWWFWTVVGAVVVTGTTVGIYYGVKEEPPDAVPFPPY